MADRTRDIAGIIDKCPDRWVKASLASLADYLVERYDEEVGAWDFMAALKGLELLANKALEASPSEEAHKKLQTDLGLAEVRIKQLQEQLTACEAALAERDARVLSLSRLVWGAVHNAGRMLTSGRVPRWVAVRDALAVGSTSANQLCYEHKLDPGEQVGRGDQCGGCEEDGGTCGGCICSEEESQFCTRSDDDLGGKCCDCERSEKKEDDREKILAELKKEGQNPPTGQLALGSWDCPTSPTGECAYDADEDPSYDDCLFCHKPDERK